jgi:calcium-dependent protein kinase
MAPEMLSQAVARLDGISGSPKAQYGLPADVFSVGVITYILLSGTVPFGGRVPEERLKARKRAERDAPPSEEDIYWAIVHEPLVFGGAWDSISSSAQELIAAMLTKDPKKRITVDEALRHPWMTEAPATPLDKSIASSILGFNANNKFKRFAIKKVAAMLSEEDVTKLREAFQAVDKDGSGLITKQEMLEALEGLIGGGGSSSSTSNSASASATVTSHSKKADEMKKILDGIDADGDGLISWTEFLEATVEPLLLDRKRQELVWEAFNEFDTDGSGFITVDELREIMKGESKDKVEKYIAEFDTDKDGTISYEEFLRMMLPKGQKLKIVAAKE